MFEVGLYRLGWIGEGDGEAWRRVEWQGGQVEIGVGGRARCVPPPPEHILLPIPFNGSYRSYLRKKERKNNQFYAFHSQWLCLIM